jgi:FHA domain
MRPRAAVIALAVVMTGLPALAQTTRIDPHEPWPVAGCPPRCEPPALTPPVTPPPQVVVPPPPWYSTAVGPTLQWSIVVALIFAGFVGVAVARQRRKILRRVDGRQPWSPASPSAALAEPVGVHISQGVAVAAGTHEDRQRLRLHPIGRNDIQPMELLFEGEVSVGRASDNEVCIFNDKRVSRKHCTLAPKGERILVADCGSRNGTWVNGVPIKGLTHAESDSILGVGRTKLRVELLPARK